MPSSSSIPRFGNGLFFDGDNNKFNAAFADERVRNLGETLADNPYIQAERKQNAEEQERLIEQFLNDEDDELPFNPEDINSPTPRQAPPRQPTSPTGTGVSYRDRLAQKKKERADKSSSSQQ